MSANDWLSFAGICLVSGVTLLLYVYLRFK